MSQDRTTLSTEALAIRNEFDARFAKKPDDQKVSPLNFLSIRLGGDAFAIRASEVAGLYADRRITPLPTAVTSLLGVVGFRGLVAPVYNLAAMLGYANNLDKSALRWLVLVRLSDPVALAFEHLQSHFSVDPGNIIQAPAENKKTHFYETVRLESAMKNSALPVISLQSILETIHSYGSKS